MQIIIFCLLLIILLLQAYTVYLISDEPEPVKEYPLPEFPAEQILKEIQRDFDQLAPNWKQPQDDGMNPQEWAIPYTRQEERKPEPKKAQAFKFKPVKTVNLKPQDKTQDKKRRENER